MKVIKCKCGNRWFWAKQLFRLDVIVDDDSRLPGLAPNDVEIEYDTTGIPYGPYKCTACGTIYDDLTDAKSCDTRDLYLPYGEDINIRIEAVYREAAMLAPKMEAFSALCSELARAYESDATGCDEPTQKELKNLYGHLHKHDELHSMELSAIALSSLITAHPPLLQLTK